MEEYQRWAPPGLAVGDGLPVDLYGRLIERQSSLSA